MSYIWKENRHLVAIQLPRSLEIRGSGMKLVRVCLGRWKSLSVKYLLASIESLVDHKLGWKIPSSVRCDVPAFDLI